MIADAVLLVGSDAPPSNLLYIHADHLGTPQKLTDAGQAIVWDGEFEPFGEEVAISGTAELPLRFPGQYADTETGYSYNYFRDYDPTLGRYLQSDPIGLVGGINTFGYVVNNPIRLADISGLIPECVRTPNGKSTRQATEVEETVLGGLRVPVASITKYGIEPDLDPPSGRTPRIGPSVEIEISVLEFTLVQVDTYSVKIYTEYFKNRCIDTVLDKCGVPHQIYFEYELPPVVKKDRTLIDSYLDTRVRKLQR